MNLFRRTVIAVMDCEHDWSKWSLPIPTLNSGHKQQWRVCQECGKAQFITLPWDEQTSIQNVTQVIQHIQQAAEAQS